MKKTFGLRRRVAAVRQVVLLTAAMCRPRARNFSWPPQNMKDCRGGESPCCLFQPVDIASLVFFRIAFGAIMLWEVCRYVHNDWIGSTFLAPAFHFKYYGFDWIRPWPGAGMYLHFLALGLLAVFVMIGFRYRLATFLFSLGFTYVFLLEKAQYLNHFYFLCLISLLMVCVPAHRAFSLDAWRNPQMRLNAVPAWSLWILRSQIAIPYVYGGIAKLNNDWLQGQPMQLWMSRMTHVTEVIPAFGELWLALVVSYGGLIFDLAVVPLLLWRRTQMAAFCVAVCFHVMNSVMFDIGIFPWIMICGTTLFLDPAWPRRLLPLQATGDLTIESADVRPGRRLVITALAVYLAFQLLVPLRHFLYPGRAAWTEEGSQFAWHMMLHDKVSVLQVRIVDMESGRVSTIDPRHLLTPRQSNQMSHDPELMRQFASFVQKQLDHEGIGPVKVQMIALCSLNGRKAQLLIDPNVDLAAQPRTILPKTWIVPLNEPLPEEPWTVPQANWIDHVDVDGDW